MDGTYNLGLVFISYVISVLGALTALQLAGGIVYERAGTQRLFPILSAAVAMGGGAVWSMHFIAMLAYRMPVMVAYDTGITLLSALVAITASAIGLSIVGLGHFTKTRLVGGGVVMGLGVAGMHYMGMSAMLMPATIQYDTPILILSVLIAIVAATAALWLAFHIRGLWQMMCSAPVMGIAVCGMHYTGMAATGYTPADTIPEAGILGTMTSHNLGVSIFVVTGILLGVALPFSYIRNQGRQVIGA